MSVPSHSVRSRSTMSRQHALEQDGLATDEVLATLDPREDEQVFDEPVQAL